MPQRRRPVPEGLPNVISRSDALTSGLTDGQIRHRVETGEWSVLGPGYYLTGALDPLDAFAQDRQRHALEALAAAHRIQGASVAFGSAALIHGMALASGVPHNHELLVPRGSFNGIRGGVRTRVADLQPDDVQQIAGVPVTTPERTWVDLSRSGSLADAFSAGDSALRRDLVDIADLETAVERHPARRGLAVPRRVLPLLSPRRENPLESKSFAAFVEWGLPLPECQVEIWGEQGFIGRVDFLWREARLIGEADGRLKYDDMGVVYAEKEREDDLRSLEYDVFRWGWGGLTDALRRRLARRLAAVA